jgi:hypothetical protein
MGIILWLEVESGPIWQGHGYEFTAQVDSSVKPPDQKRSDGSRTRHSF